MEYSVGDALTEKVRDAIKLVPKNVWTAACDADGGVRDGGDVAELTGLRPVRLAQGMRIIVRRERPHPGAQLSLFEERDAWCYQAISTNTQTGQLAFPRSTTPRARPRRRPHPARQGHRSGPVPVPEFAVNQAWLTVVMIAGDLVAWTRLLALTGDAGVLAT